MERFTDVELAINVLKHGKGRSYNILIAKGGGTLKEKLKDFDLEEYEENDIAALTTQIDVNDEFIYKCIDLITEISELIAEAHPDVFL